MKCPKCRTDNRDDSRFCRGCGTTLESPGPPPEPRDRLSFTQTLETPLDDIATGTTFAGRYQIIEELGGGGMGRVFKAYDTEVKEKVALKLIRPEVAADRRTIERFRSELRLARRIRHPRVCQMFDLNQEKGTYYITMEYVSGEDLRSFLRRSKELAVGTAVAVARQVCEGLAEAHKTGIVHRDLKPSNIMIDREGNARIMDFGIARSAETKGTTGAGVMVGTPEYMSPEQVEGKPADGRADIYALGVILFEMVTGRLPFEGATALSIAVKQKTEPPPDPRELAPHIPAELGRLILRCLEKDREKRYQSADEVFSELIRITRGVPAAERSKPIAARRLQTSREITLTFGLKKTAMIGLGVIVLAAAALFIWKPWKDRSAPLSSGDKATLAVLNFENTSRDESLTGWQTGIPLLLTTDLGQSRLLSVLSDDQVYGILKSLDLQDAGRFSSEDLVRIARQGRVTHTITGNIMRGGERIIVVLTVKNLLADEVRHEKFECAGEKEIYGLVDNMTPWVKQIIGLSRSKISGDYDALTMDISTSSLEALKFYNEGRRFHIDANFAASIPLMLKAVEKDPEFASAYRSLSSSCRGLGRGEEADRYIKLALEHSGKASIKERFHIQFTYYQLSERTHDKVLEVCRNWLELYPDDSTALTLIGNQYLALEDFALAVKYLDMSVGKGDISPFTFYYLGQAYLQSGACDKAIQIAERGLAIHPNNMLIGGVKFDCYLAQGKFDEAQAWLEEAELKRPGGYIDFRKGDLLTLKGKYSEAAAIYVKNDTMRNRLSHLRLMEGKIGQAIALAREANDHLSLAYLNYREKKWPEALVESRTALEDALKQGSFTNQAWALQHRGFIDLAVGSTEEAKKTASELEAALKPVLNKKLLRHNYLLAGMIERKNRRYGAAVDLLNKAIALLPGASWSFGNYWYDLFHDSLAGTYYESGNLAKAEEEYKRIQALTVGRLRYGDIYAASFYWLGRIAEQRGRKTEAGEYYRQFLDVWKDADPGWSEVEDARTRLASLK